MIRKYRQLIFGFLFAGLAGLNAWLFLHRNEGYAYKEALSYDQLYQNKDESRIIEFRIGKKDSLELLLNDSQTTDLWQISLPDQRGYDYKANPKIKLSAGKQNYRLQRVKGATTTIELGINYTSTDTYAKHGRTRESVVELFSSNVPAGNYELHAIVDWEAYSMGADKKEVDEARDLIRREAGILPLDSDATKVEKIADLILKKLDDKRGIPTDEMDALSPMERFKHAIRGSSAVWCGDLSDILSFFLNSNGIPTRLVALGDKINEVYTAGHVFNEVYLKETKAWAIIDLTSRAIFAKDKRGQYLNALDLHQRHLQDQEDVRIRYWRADSISDQTYETVKPFYAYYFGTGTVFRYYLKEQFNKESFSTFSKLRRYLLPTPTFAVYAGSTELNNEKFYHKQLAAMALLLCGLFWIVSLAANYTPKK